MNQDIQEYVDSRGVDLRVDREAGVVRGVKILGLESRNRRSYSPQALSRAIELYEGAKVNVNHPKGDPLAPRDYQDRIGVIRNVVLRDDQGLFGDFHFNPKHALAEQLVWDAQHAAENVGFSHNVQARVAKKADTSIVEEILQVQSVDLVADPATTRGLFEQQAGDVPLVEDDAWQTVTLEQIERLKPDLIQALEQKAVASVAAKHHAQLEELQSQLDVYQARETLDRRREQIGKLLVEYQLPDPASGDPTADAIVSDEFMGRLMATESEDQLRSLVRDRATLVRNLGGSFGGPRRGRPMSRDQTVVDRHHEAQQVADAKSFADAIT